MKLGFSNILIKSELISQLFSFTNRLVLLTLSLSCCFYRSLHCNSGVYRQSPGDCTHSIPLELGLRGLEQSGGKEKRNIRTSKCTKRMRSTKKLTRHTSRIDVGLKQPGGSGWWAALRQMPGTELVYCTSGPLPSLPVSDVWSSSPVFAMWVLGL